MCVCVSKQSKRTHQKQEQKSVKAEVWSVIATEERACACRGEGRGAAADARRQTQRLTFSFGLCLCPFLVCVSTDGVA